MLPWLDIKVNLLTLKNKSRKSADAYFCLAILLATSAGSQKAAAQGERPHPKHACPSSLFARAAVAAPPVPSCRKGHASPPSSPGPSSSGIPQIVPPGERQGNEHEARLFVFISFSMPEASLKRLAQEAETHKATLVMRGLYEDSFAKTAQKIQKLGISVDINPELFEAHNVKIVPTFVWAKQGHPVQILKGNVTLAFAVKTFEGRDSGGRDPESRDSEGQQSLKEAP